MIILYFCYILNVNVQNFYIKLLGFDESGVLYENMMALDLVNHIILLSNPSDIASSRCVKFTF